MYLLVYEKTQKLQPNREHNYVLLIFLVNIYLLTNRILPASLLRIHLIQNKQIIQCCSSHDLRHDRSGAKSGGMSRYEENVNRRLLLFLSVTTSLFPTLSSSGKTKSKSQFDERRLLEQNKRIQKENNAPEDFPSFIREGFQVQVVTPENYTKCDSGLIYRDFVVGEGDFPQAGQQVMFHYVGYNESGRRIDSSYTQGSPARIRMGTNALVPGPSTFFSSKQFEVFDVELLSIQNCRRRTVLAFYSDFSTNHLSIVGFFCSLRPGIMVGNKGKIKGNSRNSLETRQGNKTGALSNFNCIAKDTEENASVPARSYAV
ncbi:FKBP-like peptidyl-prolyl cis-trans isomerase family protein [Prunus dulcis]|uniref:peptidylprolyl isomerase n=1 Tax=Prunus dulcis TaxID=3755 RepID=A0A4Y1QZL0_PRUDU|nr:FKBP-like peptidyl-prolyl cis-trans isomerase family protein [Prunus dulcis]